MARRRRLLARLGLFGVRLIRDGSVRDAGDLASPPPMIKASLTSF